MFATWATFWGVMIAALALCAWHEWEKDRHE